MPTTSNYNWPLPTPDGSAGVWDDILNGTLEAIDTQVAAVATQAGAALSRAGGTMTGEIEHKASRFTIVNQNAMSGAVSLDANTAQVHYGTVTGNITSFTITGLTSGKAEFIALELTNGGSRTITWGAAVKWDNGVAPTLKTTGVDLIIFYSRDGGTTLRARRVYTATT